MIRTKTHRRAGMTILEVLFAIMITTVGLLGAIAVFPVASEYARKGRLNDEVTVCAESAVHAMDARGMRRPDHWMALIDNSPNPPAVYTGPQLGPLAPAGAWRGFSQTSFCIDPRFTAQNIPNNVNYEWTYFPAFPRQVAVAANNPGSPRMQRITLANGSPGANPPYAPAFVPMGRFQADYVFSFPDQLMFERPGVQRSSTNNDNASPAFQLYSPIKDPNNPGTIYPGKREDEGKLSWMATLVPKIDRWNATLDDKYVLSTVVFYNRSPNLVVDLTGASGPLNEWTATILGTDFHSSGYGGGEVTLTATGPGAADRLKVRSGDWVMLSANVRANIFINNTLTVATVPHFKWYRVSDADEDPYEQLPIGSGIFKRDVTLVGPDWDLQDVFPTNGSASPNGGDSIPDDVEVIIVPHVVAVFDRTVRLEFDGTG